MKNILIILFFSQIKISLFGQENLAPDYILYENKDTMFCLITRLERGSGFVYSMIYVDEKNVSHTINKKEAATIKSFRVGGYVNDYLPLDASKPDKYHRHIELKIDGKIKIYDHIRLNVSTDSETGERKFSSVVGAGAKIYTIKLDNGGYYDINNKNLTDYIIPYMKNCQEFMKTNTERITVDNIEKIVGIYNESCKEE